MIRFVAVRGVESLVVLAIMSFVVYGLIGLMPGDPVDIMLAGDPNMTPEDRIRLRALYGLDVPIYQRYFTWLGAALGGDLGYSRGFSRPVLEVMTPYLGRTALLMFTSFLLSVAIADETGALVDAPQRDEPLAVRTPSVARITISASSAVTTHGSSAAGSACATLPQIVPRLRICGWAM